MQKYKSTAPLFLSWRAFLNMNVHHTLMHSNPEIHKIQKYIKQKNTTFTRYLIPSSEHECVGH